MTELARRVAAYGLPGARSFPRSPVDDRLWAAVVGRLRDEKLLGPLAHAVGDGALPVTPAQRETVATEHAAAMSVTLVLERELVRVAGRLAAGGVDYRVLKGAAVARTVYPDPSWRTFRDVDILVPGDRFDRAVGLLAGLGYRRRAPELRSGFDRRFGKGATLVGAPGYEVDVHRTFVPGRYGLRMHADDLFFGGVGTIALGGVTVLTLPPTGRFLNACYHAALGGPVATLAAHRDVAQMLVSPGLDPSAVLRVARSWDAEAVVATAVARAVEQLGLRDAGPLASWAAAYRPRRIDRRAVRSYTSHRSFSRQAVSGLTSVPGLLPKFAYLAAVAGARRPTVP